MNPPGGEGAEVVYALRNNDELARKITEEIGKEGQKIRKYYQRRLPENPMQDYYYIQRLTGDIQSLLVEYGFIDNANDIKKLRNNLTDYVEGVVRAIANYAGYPYTPPSESESSTGDNTYTVKRGDSLWLIAERYNTTVQELKKLNNLTSNTLQIGQVLKLPTSNDNTTDTTIYIVQKNDSLWTIAQKFNTTVQELKALNNLTSDILQIGQELLIKDIVETPQPTPPTQTSTYTVQRGDSLWSIANRYNTTVQELRNLNNLTNDTLMIGQILNVPGTGNETEEEIYIVQRGDSLWLIAQKYNIGVNDLIKANNLSGNTIQIGDQLVIPKNTTNSQPATYIVQRGDSLWSIANRYNTTIQSLRNLNNLTSDTLTIGQRLIIR